MSTSEPVAVAYVSQAMPDQPAYRNEAMHVNGNIFMRNILIGLLSMEGSEVSAFSARPLASYPRSREIFVPRETAEVLPGKSSVCVPFINITPVKQVTIGVAMLWHLLGWGLNTMKRRHRVIVSFNISVPPLAFTMLAARILRATLIVYICDLNTGDCLAPRTFLHRLDRLETWLLRWVDGGITISDRIGFEYLAHCGYVRVDGGVSQALIDSTGRALAERQTDVAHFTIGATGSLSAHNGILEILRAFSELNGPHFRLLLAGRGPLESEVLRAVKSDPRVEFRGYLDTDDLLTLHAACDVLVSLRLTQTLNSAYGFPSKTFEYLLSGVPVITTATGHMKTEYGRWCFVLDDETPSALAHLLREVAEISQTERRRIGLAARQFMISHKSWEQQHARIATYVRSRVLSF